MRWLLSFMGVVLALVFIGASGAMNFLFMHGQGKTEMQALVLGSVSAAGDGFKALLPLYIAYAWQARRFTFVAIASLVFVCLISWALVSAIGFAAQNRGALTGGREAVSIRYELAKKELASIDTRVSNIRTYETFAGITAKLDGKKQHRRWRTTKGCTDATTTKSRKFCTDFAKLKSQLAASIEAKQLRERQGVLRANIARLLKAGANQSPDEQASLFARLAGVDLTTVQMALIIALAVLVELGAGFGLYLATSHSIKPARHRPAVKTTEQPASDQSTNDKAAADQAAPPAPQPNDVLEPIAAPLRLAASNADQPRRFQLDASGKLISDRRTG